MKLSERYAIVLDLTILLCAVFLVYGRVMGYGFQTHWDDNVYILNNPSVHGFSWDNIRSAFNFSENKAKIHQYNPISLLSFMLDYTLWKANPAGYHFTNIVLHCLNGVLVYRLMLRLQGERLVAVITSALFLLHPVQVESVAWISERKGLLSMLFLLVSWEFYCRFSDGGRGRVASYVVSLSAFVVSLMAKTAGVILPVALVLYDICFRNRRLKDSLLDKLPFVAASAFFSLIEVFSEKSLDATAMSGYHGGSPLATFYTMLTVFVRYLKLLVWPTGLNIEHQPTIFRSPELPVIGAAVLLGLIAVGGWLLYKKDRRLGFWVMFFWLCLLPVSQIVPLIQMMYEHYLYVPIIAVGGLIGHGAGRLRDRGAGFAAGMYALLAVWVVVLSIMSYQRSAVWKDTVTLFSDAAEKSPNAPRVWETLGEVHRYLGNVEESRKSLEKALTLRPGGTDALWALGELHTESGNHEEGQKYLKRLFEINPKYVMGWATLGNNHVAKKEYATARLMYQRALELQPEAIQVNMLLGKLGILEKNFDDARRNFALIEADKRKWNLAENAYQMVRVEAGAGRLEEAFNWLEIALQRGYQDYYQLNTNVELVPLWNNARFAVLMQRYFPDQESRR